MVMTIGEAAKRHGLKSSDVVAFTGQSIQTLNNWSKKKAAFLECVLLGCVEYAKGQRLDFKHVDPAKIAKYHGFASLNQVCKLASQKRHTISFWVDTKPLLFQVMLLGALVIKSRG